MVETAFEEDIVRCLAVLHAGGLILYPTDTVWGIGCDATRADAVEKIFALKRRPPAKSLIVLLADERDIFRYVSQPNPAVSEFLQTVSRPTTMIYEGALGLAPNLVGADGSVAIRLVREDFCRHLIRRFRKPLVSTSANLSGQPSPAGFDGIPREILEGVDYTVRYRRGDAAAAVSDIARMDRAGNIEWIRR